MPWIRLNETNFRDYIAPVEDVEGGNPNRGFFGEGGNPELVSADVEGVVTYNTLLNYYGFNYTNTFTSKKIRGMRVTCLNRNDDPPTNPGWEFFRQSISNNVTIVTDINGNEISGIGQLYDYSGGVQLTAADLAGPTIYSSDLDFRRNVPRVFEVLLPNTGTQEVILLQSGTSIYTDDDINGEIGTGYAEYYIDVFTEDDTPEPTARPTYPVYEMEKGWSFDGNFIPHFVELNWLFQEDPFTYKSINKIRIHGLTKGVVNLQVQLSGMQGDITTDYIQDYTDPQFIDLPFTPIYVQDDFLSVTNYVDYSSRGIALQMKFEGRNKDIAKPEPSHVLQILALQGTPEGNGKRAN